jgi:hypothetical protein
VATAAGGPAAAQPVDLSPVPFQAAPSPLPEAWQGSLHAFYKALACATPPVDRTRQLRSQLADGLVLGFRCWQPSAASC